MLRFPFLFSLFSFLLSLALFADYLWLKKLLFSFFLPFWASLGCFGEDEDTELCKLSLFFFPLSIYHRFFSLDIIQVWLKALGFCDDCLCFFFNQFWSGFSCFFLFVCLDEFVFGRHDSDCFSLEFVTACWLWFWKLFLCFYETKSWKLIGRIFFFSFPGNVFWFLFSEMNSDFRWEMVSLVSVFSSRKTKRRKTECFECFRSQIEFLSLSDVFLW